MDKNIIKDIIQLLQGIDYSLREYRGKYCDVETDLNSIIEENVKAFDRLEKRQKKVQEQRKREIEKIRKEVQGMMYYIRDDCNKLAGKSWEKIDKFLDKLE